MFISIVQNEIFHSEEEAYQCTCAATANWTGGSGKYLEMDLMQENRYKDLKKMIKSLTRKKDLQNLKPYKAKSKRKHISFLSVSSNPLQDLDEIKFNIMND